MTRKEIRIGLFGFGCVGQGLYRVLNQNPGFHAEIVRIGVKHTHKKRSLPSQLFTFHPEEILDDPAINTVVELIDDPDQAYIIARKALLNGKHFISANKRMLAHHLEELSRLAAAQGVAFLYEGSVCGSIPVIRNLEEYYDNEFLLAVRGIFNGSTNYILTRLGKDGTDYHEALLQAQEAGFAESDPTLDVQAYDPLYKTVILAAHAFGLFIQPEEVFHLGIDAVSSRDLQFAREKGWKVKLVAEARKVREGEVALYILPRFITPESWLYHVDEEYNGVELETAFADRQFLQGKGAGGDPTGSAVLSDISACAYDYRYEYKKARQGRIPRYTTDISLNVYLRIPDPALLDRLPLKEVYEEYRSRDFIYLTGSIHLDTLRKENTLLREAGIFICELPQTSSARTGIHRAEVLQSLAPQSLPVA